MSEYQQDLDNEHVQFIMFMKGISKYEAQIMFIDSCKDPIEVVKNTQSNFT